MFICIIISHLHIEFELVLLISKQLTVILNLSDTIVNLLFYKTDPVFGDNPYLKW